MMKGIVALLVITLHTSACVTVDLTPAGAQVRLTTNADVIQNCKYIGQVQGTDHMNGGLAGQGAAEENAVREIKNNAANMGANTVHIATKTTGFSGSAIRGEAYSCQVK